MDEFLRLSIRNQIRNDDTPADEFCCMFNEHLEEIKKYLNADLAENIENRFFDLAADSFEFAALWGMKLAIGVLNGTIKQVIEM